MGGPRAAGRLRVVGSQVVDTTAVISLCALVAWLDLALESHNFTPHAGTPFDMWAQWLHAHAGVARHTLLFTLLCGTAYQLLHGLRGWPTLGQRLTRTALVRQSGKPMRWFVVTVRAIGTWVSLAFFGAGYFWLIVDRRGRAWHDLVSGTVLVRNATAAP